MTIADLIFFFGDVSLLPRSVTMPSKRLKGSKTLFCSASVMLLLRSPKSLVIPFAPSSELSLLIIPLFNLLTTTTNTTGRHFQQPCVNVRASCAALLYPMAATEP